MVNALSPAPITTRAAGPGSNPNGPNESAGLGGNNLTLASHFKLYTPLERACYAASLALVAEVDDHLSQCTRHYRNRRGKLLQTLDEVVVAIVADDLMEAEPVELERAA